MFAPRMIARTARLTTASSLATKSSITRINLHPRLFSDVSANAGPEQPPKAENTPPPSDGQTDKVEAKSPEIEKLEAEVKNLKDQLLRAYADSENTRRIAQRDVENARQYSVNSFAKALLDIADDLDRALSTVPADKRKTGDAVFDNLVIGIEMTEKNLQKAFRQFGVVKYGESGEKFDPNLHDALFQVQDPSKEANTIAQIVKHGYKIKDRVLRPAQVGANMKSD